MKAIYALVVVAAAAAVVSLANAKATIQDKHPIDWYDCSTKKDGNYIHPSDCTRFISCSGGVASERDCPNCDTPGRCRDGRLVYNATVNECRWADQTRCETGGEDDSTAITEQPTTTTEESSEEDSPSTEASNPQPPKEGDPCDPERCVNTGYCQSFLRCDKDSSTLKKEECGENLVWNPLNPNGTDQIHGGNCDIWENLDPQVERRYRSDEECLACFWRALGECSQEYLYQPANGTHRNVLTLSCADGLVFSQKKETCQRCEDVLKQDGTSCC